MLPLDTHAHIRPDILPQELEVLDACVIAACRSLGEYEGVAGRNDPSVAWGVGCHPGLARAIREFEPDRFRGCLATAAAVAEVGLDGSSRVPMEDQVAVFDRVLGALADTPRLTSVHSYKATAPVVELLERHRPTGVILHWWLGDEEATDRAIDAGALFSLNGSQARRWPLVTRIPPDRILLETDHPFGDRQSKPQRPGNLADVEKRVASVLQTTGEDLRRQGWLNLHKLVGAMPEVGPLLPRDFQVQMLAL